MKIQDIVNDYKKDGYSVDIMKDDYIRFKKDKSINQTIFWSCLIVGLVFPPLLLVCIWQVVDYYLPSKDFKDVFITKG